MRMAPGLGRRHSLASVVFMIWMIDSRRSVVEIGGFADEGHGLPEQASGGEAFGSAGADIAGKKGDVARFGGDVACCVDVGEVARREAEGECASLAGFEGHSAEAYELAAGRRGADGAALVGNHAGRLVQGFGIERGGQSDGLRKYGHLFAGAGHSVQAFVPPIV